MHGVFQSYLRVALMAKDEGLLELEDAIKDMAVQQYGGCIDCHKFECPILGCMVPWSVCIACPESGGCTHYID